MKTLARTLCLFLIALPLGCDGGRSDERAGPPPLAPSYEGESEPDAGVTGGDASEAGGADLAEPDLQPKPNAGRAETSGADVPPAAIERGAELPRDLWIWPDPREPAPDLDADIHDCSNQLAEDPELSARPALAQLGWILDCMAGRGWARNPDFEPSRG